MESILCVSHYMEQATHPKVFDRIPSPSPSLPLSPPLRDTCSFNPTSFTRELLYDNTGECRLDSQIEGTERFAGIMTHGCLLQNRRAPIWINIYVFLGFNFVPGKLIYLPTYVPESISSRHL